MDISYRKTFQGAWELSTLVDQVLFTRQYMGYTKREATKEFKLDIKEKDLPLLERRRP